MMDVGRKTKMEKTTAKHMSTAQMTVTALMTAITCILAPMALPIPISPVPISLTNLVIFFMAYILGMKLSVASYVLYLLLGTVGLPVFSGFSGGVGKLLGPTGGYLIGFIFLAAIAGFFVEKFPAKIYMHVVGMIIGMAICYIFGTAWLAGQLGMSFRRQDTSSAAFSADPAGRERKTEILFSSPHDGKCLRIRHPHRHRRRPQRTGLLDQMEQTAGTFTKESEVVIVAEKNSDVRYHGEHLLSRIIMIIICNCEDTGQLP